MDARTRKTSLKRVNKIDLSRSWAAATSNARVSNVISWENKWCRPEMSAISGLIQTQEQRTPCKAPPPARKTRVTDDKAKGVLARRKMERDV